MPLAKRAMLWRQNLTHHICGTLAHEHTLQHKLSCIPSTDSSALKCVVGRAVDYVDYDDYERASIEAVWHGEVTLMFCICSVPSTRGRCDSSLVRPSNLFFVHPSNLSFPGFFCGRFT